MLSVLVVVLCHNCIAILSFSAGQRQISLIALFHVLKALRLRSGWSRCPTIQPGGTRSELALSRGWPVVISHVSLWEGSLLGVYGEITNKFSNR
jgi:hypothetical protein